MNQVTTKSDLERLGLDALNKEKAGEIAVSRVAGGVSFATAIEVMEFAKLMAVADKAVPRHLRSNPGACLRIVFQAVEWQMSPWAVADKSYEVNDRIAYESQLIHAVIEARAPLQHRLVCEYVGEAADRQCRVTGQFTNGDMREYLSPKIKDIKVKNSPLWTADPDQQLWYYASRAWARKWCPDVLMGIYTREELQENPGAGREYEERTIDGAGLHQRLAGSEISRDEGHRPGHVESELDSIGAGATVDATVTAAGEASTVEPTTTKTTRAQRKKSAEPNVATDQLEELPTPKTAAEYANYCARWLAIMTNPAEIKARWKKEMKLRNDCGVTSEDRAPLDELTERRLAELGK